jgi:N-acyl-D-amino-acid deacylase
MHLLYDLIIKGGKLVDGAGNPWYYGDIAINNGKIATGGKLSEAEANRVLDVSGLVVAPGFIDAHSHSDGGVIVYPQMESTLAQGITTVVAGQCGGSPAPVNPDMRELLEEEYAKHMPPGVEFKITWTTFDEYLKRVEEVGVGANIAHHVGHSTIRVAAIGFDARQPTEAELEDMRKLTEEAMEAGAYGLSTGLIYPPGMYASTDEIVELAKVVASYGGVYDSHIRGEGATLLKAVAEAIEIGEKAGLPVHISHHKAAGKSVWGQSVETLKMMEEARNRVLDITFDQYPYRAGSTSLATLLPPWAHDGGTEKLLGRLRNAEDRERMRRDIEKGIPGWENFVGALGWENIMVSFVKSEENKDIEGKNMVKIKEMRGEPDEFTALYKLLLEEEGAPGMVIFAMQEEDVQRIMKHHLHMVGTDASSVAFTGPFAMGKPHPRHFGTYPKILGRYVREYRMLRLEEAVRKMTSFPTQRFGILDRGLLRPGMCADIAIFNPDTVLDKATYQEPQQRSVGIEYVIVNGEVAIDAGKYTGALAGKVLRKI